VDAIGGCFDDGAVGRDRLIERALQNGASPGVVETLERLPDRILSDIRQIWELVPEIPVER